MLLHDLVPLKFRVSTKFSDHYQLAHTHTHACTHARTHAHTHTCTYTHNLDNALRAEIKRKNIHTRPPAQRRHILTGALPKDDTS